MSQKPITNLSKPLKSVIERIEKLEEEKRAIGDDIKDIYLEAKGNGMDTKTIREMIKVRKADTAEFQEREFLRDSYLRALGLIEELV